MNNLLSVSDKFDYLYSIQYSLVKQHTKIVTRDKNTFFIIPREMKPDNMYEPTFLYTIDDLRSRGFAINLDIPCICTRQGKYGLIQVIFEIIE